MELEKPLKNAVDLLTKLSEKGSALLGQSQIRTPDRPCGRYDDSANMVPFDGIAQSQELLYDRNEECKCFAASRDCLNTDQLGL